jgi:uridylate kinase
MKINILNTQMNGEKMPELSTPHFKRVLLKISGEVLMGSREYGIDPETCDRMASEIKAVTDLDVQVCVTIGAGNIFRGVAGAAGGMDRVTGDYIGMLAIIMNALALQSSLEKIGIHTRVQSAIPVDAVCEPFIRRRAVRHVEKGRVVIFAAGTGNPYFTSDTAAALRASEMSCDVMLKGTKVNGIYTSDPHKDPKAVHIPELTHMDVLQKDLKVMDPAAISLARDNNIPVVVFNIREPGNFKRVVCGDGQFTIVKGKG